MKNSKIVLAGTLLAVAALTLPTASAGVDVFVCTLVTGCDEIVDVETPGPDCRWMLPSVKPSCLLTGGGGDDDPPIHMDQT